MTIKLVEEANQNIRHFLAIEHWAHGTMCLAWTQILLIFGGDDFIWTGLCCHCGNNTKLWFVGPLHNFMYLCARWHSWILRHHSKHTPSAKVALNLSFVAVNSKANTLWTICFLFPSKYNPPWNWKGRMNYRYTSKWTLFFPLIYVHCTCLSPPFVGFWNMSTYYCSVFSVRILYLCPSEDARLLNRICVVCLTWKKDANFPLPNWARPFNKVNLS